MEMFSDGDLSAPEIRSIARGLYAVALVDGLHEREVVFISELLRDHTPDFESNNVSETPATLESLAWLTPVEPPALAALLPTATHRRLFLKAAYMLAWADGKVSFAERASIDAFASALGVAASLLSGLEGEVKEHLILEKPKRLPSATASEVERL